MNMQTPDSTSPAPAAAESTLPPPVRKYAPTPVLWRIGIAILIFAIAGIAFAAKDVIGLRGQALAGILFFFGIVAVFSANLRAVNWGTIGWGIGLQLALAGLVIRGRFQINGEEYSVYNAFYRAGDVVKAFISYSDAGAEFVFGNLSHPEHLSEVFGKNFLFPFAFKALPPILFVSAFFTVLYHFGILQWCVRVLARVMVYLMGTSGAETLSVSANVFMGQTEAPLIVKPYVPRMTNSELFALMASGMAHISGGMMAVYINYGADPVAVLTTCVMACPCSLYLAKLFYPETAIPETSGTVDTKREPSPYVNAVDAAASGTSDGLRLALNVAAMLIVFIAFVKMFDGALGLISTAWLERLTGADLPDYLTLQFLFGKLFAPVAFLMGIEDGDQQQVGSLLGSKLAINEHYAYLQLKEWKGTPNYMSERSYQLAA